MGNFANEKKSGKRKKNRGYGNHLTRSHSSVFEQPHLLLVKRRCFFASFSKQQVHQQQVYPSLSGNRSAYELWTMLWAESLKSPAHHRWEGGKEGWGRVTNWKFNVFGAWKNEKLLLQTTLLIALEKKEYRGTDKQVWKSDRISAVNVKWRFRQLSLLICCCLNSKFIASSICGILRISYRMIVAASETR